MGAHRINLLFILKIAFRNWRRTPLFSIVNLLGLAVGIASCLLIGIYVLNELSYDEYHENSDRIYRVTQALLNNGEDDGRSVSTPFPLKGVIDNELQGSVAETVRFFDLESESVSIKNPENNVVIRQNRFFFTDPEVFQVFDINLIRGDSGQVLSEPNSVVISENVASIYFGDEDPMGKTFHFEGRIALTVTGVMENWPQNSHFKADFLTPFSTLRNLWGNYEQLVSRWRWNPVWTYILTEPGVDDQQLEQSIVEISDPFYDEYFTGSESVDLALQPLEDIWLTAGLDSEIEPVSNSVNVYLFGLVAIFILTLACINFINLSTASALRRSKEVGVRKVLGAERSGIAGQFLVESIIFTFAAFLVGILIGWLAFPYFEMFTGRELMSANLDLPEIVFSISVFIVVIALLAGFYPSAVLSSFNPIESLRGKQSKGKKGTRVRKALVLVQFSITAILLIGTSLVYFQHQHLQQKDLGFDTEQIIAVPVYLTSAIWSYDELKQRALSHSSILQVSGVQALFGSSNFWKYDYTPDDTGGEDAPSFSKLFVLHDILETMDIDIIAGRDFSEDFSTDGEQALLVNREMVDYMEWGDPEDAIGRTFRDPNGERYSVVGVTENFNHTYLRRELEPLILDLPANTTQLIANIEYMKVRLAPGNPSDAIEHLQTIWAELDQTHPFDYFFVDDRLNQLYEPEQKVASVMGVFALIAIFVGSIGLLGLASYSVKVREKEVAIRKVLGLSAPGVFYLLSKDYVMLIVIAHLIALPVIYFAADGWLANFPYRIELMYYLMITFVMSLVISLLISIGTISTQSVKAALLNPAESLKNE
ncbi:ABC transporter permease [Rhodohalobacter sp.]|uniref:ABC transporter permease n=1 Tax=Rhodohalobacter sp. TaxID=1974210 RepID=UPI002ACE0434|nr:ABC transporter permease [Rhodohalobacter sp.]MDZ7754978.1 FtsX-like permease family protein [Rhodohalobacter sp.]